MPTLEAMDYLRIHNIGNIWIARASKKRTRHAYIIYQVNPMWMATNRPEYVLIRNPDIGSTFKAQGLKTASSVQTSLVPRIGAPVEEKNNQLLEPVRDGFMKGHDLKAIRHIITRDDEPVPVLKAILKPSTPLPPIERNSEPMTATEDSIKIEQPTKAFVTLPAPEPDLAPQTPPAPIPFKPLPPPLPVAAHLDTLRDHQSIDFDRTTEYKAADHCFVYLTEDQVYEHSKDPDWLAKFHRYWTTPMNMGRFNDWLKRI